MTEFEDVLLTQHMGPTIKANARLIWEGSTQRDGDQRWSEAEIWETKGGAWLVVNASVTDASDKRDYDTVTVVDAFLPAWQRETLAMGAMNWKSLAWKAKRALKWDMVREVA